MQVLLAQAVDHHQAGRLTDAEARYRQVLAVDARHADALHLLGIVGAQGGRHALAIEMIGKAIAVNPAVAEFHFNLALALQQRDQADAAVHSYQRALTLRPDYAEALANLGLALQAQGRLTQAIACCELALYLRPAYAEALAGLGNVLTSQGRSAQAGACYRQALAQQADFHEAHSGLLLSLLYDGQATAAEIFAEHRRWDALHASVQPHLMRAPRNDDEGRRLRVAYVSPDLREHAVAYFFEPLLRQHDRRAIEVFCYAEVARPDATSARLRGLADHWCSSVGMSDAALAQRITADRIDILVDLAGHTEHNRLLVFARKPAPVQLSWLGYAHSTGLSAMDYRLVDAISDPPGPADACASETLVRLPGGFLCYQAPAWAPPVAPPPCLATGRITFASFNNPAKLSAPTLDAWTALLRRLPDAQLLLKGGLFADAASAAALLTQLLQRGVPRERIILRAPLSEPREHLALYAEVDIALDPFPYNGTTTTCEALWMGVPVVTLRGDRHAARVGASLLAQIGMQELSADSVSAYVDMALALAGQRQCLSTLRQELRARLAQSPLCDAPAFAARVEAAYRSMWQRHCRRPPS